MVVNEKVATLGIENSVSHKASKWFSSNPDKAWGEKFFLCYIPICFAYQAAMIKFHFLDSNDFWFLLQHVIMWIPYCLVLPLILRRNSGVPWQKSYWFKFNIYIFIYGFFATYFHTKYFFDILGLRYHLKHVTMYYDAFLIGPDPQTALQDSMRVPLGFYITAFAFFNIYHTGGVVIIRRIKNLIAERSAAVRAVGGALIVFATAWFFGWAEPYFYNASPDVKDLAYYVNTDAMLKYGSIFYAMYFIVSFPNVFRLDENPSQPSWSIGRTIIEASFVSMLSLFLIDNWGWVFGATIYGTPIPR